eukprot:4837433-Lingulodinium_polyedra.AAC.1
MWCVCNEFQATPANTGREPKHAANSDWRTARSKSQPLLPNEKRLVGPLPPSSSSTARRCPTSSPSTA